MVELNDRKPTAYDAETVKRLADMRQTRRAVAHYTTDKKETEGKHE